MKMFLSLFFFLLISNNSYCEIYKWTDDQGKVHFGDKRPDAQKVEQLDLEINTYSNVTYSDSIFGDTNRVVMYSAEWCGFCKKAKKYFIKRGIPFVEYDIEKDISAKRRHKEMGATGVPVILFGKKRMNGFTVEGFERMYK